MELPSHVCHDHPSFIHLSAPPALSPFPSPPLSLSSILPMSLFSFSACRACTRRLTRGTAQQIRHKSKTVKATTISVRLLQDVPKLGRKGKQTVISCARPSDWLADGLRFFRIHSSGGPRNDEKCDPSKKEKKKSNSFLRVNIVDLLPSSDAIPLQIRRIHDAHCAQASPARRA